ncbi:putative alpha-ketoglutarate-dependent sulfonate dioxygenase [Exophiala viscosa]|uniref:Alpha-ketoglutarate-dependent sulfonate dioxygenase n=1 Tax=Exophiala viscosa TaxID=2486360 RepID=A0AAN6IKE2_9EURO|nr:putative alpha-ketoglutarate-dependent sulfonate dioxygenase [Exophiala viscosa]KAI1627607.1 putative alpha-ketoglutarate-dependent sulfonate dioxygenase [Exophiala viscosa]
MSSSHTGITEEVLTYKPPHPPVKEFEPATDRAFFADPEKKSLLAAAQKVRNLTPYIGTELVGIQISQLTDAQKDELALLVAERGVVFFRNQDITLDQQYELTTHYGIQDRDPNQVDPRHVTILGRNNDIRAYADFAGEYHSDHSFEANPPAYTMLRMIKTPDAGGDTIFTSQTALFDKLSPTFQNLFEGLHGVHSSEHVFVNSVNGGNKPFRPPVRREHPLVRTHPVTKLKSLFYNPAFVIHISELKGQESIHTLGFLREHLHAADDLTVRWKWEPGSVAFWDNRVVVHRAIPGGYDPSTREGKRTAIYGEKPFFDPSGETLSQRIERLGGEAAKGEIVKLHFNSPQL